MIATISSAWQWYMESDVKAKLLFTIGIAMVYVGWKIIKLMWPRKSHKYTGAYDEKGLYHDGHGLLEMVNNDAYSGSFVHGQIDGQGKYVFRNGGWYEGQFKNGLYHGRGVEQYKDGMLYTGEFIGGHRMGKGCMKYANGSSYTGDWLMGRKHGRGVFVLANGSKFDGEFRKGVKHGAGMHSSADGKTWLKGVWRNGKLHTTIDKHDESAECTES